MTIGPDSSDGEGHLDFLARVVYRAHCQNGHPVGVHRETIGKRKCYVANECLVCKRLEEHKRAADEAASAAAQQCAREGGQVQQFKPTKQVRPSGP